MCQGRASEVVSWVCKDNAPGSMTGDLRVRYFSSLLGEERGFRYDCEAVYLASLLHDLGLTAEYVADNRFEVDGAVAASRFLVADGYQ